MKKFFFFVLFCSLINAADIPQRPDIRPFDTKISEWKLVSTYGQRTRKGITKFHSGNDYSLYLDTPVWASGDGEIIFSRACGDYGNLIIIRHDWELPDGKKITCFSYYAHLVEFKRLSGEYVLKGEVIGLCGMTGDADGTHVHFEIRDGNKNPIWPGYYMAEKNRECAGK